MIQLFPDQVAAAQKTGLDIVFSLTGKMVEGIGKLFELNGQVIRATLAEIREHAQEALSVKDPQEWLALQATFAAPMPEKVHSYGSQLFGIISATQAEFAQLAQAQYDVFNRRVKMLVDDVASSAPAGSEAAVPAWKSVIIATGTLHDTLQKTGQQVLDVTRRNFDIAADAAARTARRAVEQASAGAKR